VVTHSADAGLLFCNSHTYHRMFLFCCLHVMLQYFFFLWKSKFTGLRKETCSMGIIYMASPKKRAQWILWSPEKFALMVGTCPLSPDHSNLFGGMQLSQTISFASFSTHHYQLRRLRVTFSCVEAGLRKRFLERFYKVSLVCVCSSFLLCIIV